MVAVDKLSLNIDLRMRHVHILKALLLGLSLCNAGDVS